ncbi:hypothetical protein [Natrinema saccharevitans]|nr:hypothetical protein [Natrinema saccharevitans]
MTEQDYSEAARHLRSDGKLETAASYYTSAAHGYLMKFKKVDSEDHGEISPYKFGHFAIYMLLGSLCYRITGERHRCRTNCEIGILVTKDIREHEQTFQKPTHEPRTGLCYELIGDFQLVGEIGSYENAYHRAEQYYETVDNPHQWSVEPEFEIQMIVLLELADSIDYKISDSEKRIYATSHSSTESNTNAITSNRFSIR